MTTDRHSRPDVFKPLIDSALGRLAAVAGVGSTVSDKLARLHASPNSTAWSYLMDAMDVVRGDFGGSFPQAEWGTHFLSGAYLNDSPSVPAKKRYPREAGPAIDERLVVGGVDADVILLWPRNDGRVSVCHAHPEGFWILGHDVVDFIERAAFEAEGKRLEDIVDDEVEALADGG